MSTYKNWTVVSEDNVGTKEYPKWLCQCLCGTTRSVSTRSLEKGLSLSCGCLSRVSHIPLEQGCKVNGITVVSYLGGKGFRYSVVYSCGHSGDTAYGCLTNSRTGKCHSCSRSSKRVKHGMSYSPTYGSWCNMKRRCYEVTHNRYESYMEKGITVHPRWLESFENFYEDMGECPKGWSLERLDLDKNYSPDNCIWASDITQANNKTNNILIQDLEGVQWSLRRWCDMLSIDYKKAWHQLRNKKMSIEDILGTGYTVVQMR